MSVIKPKVRQWQAAETSKLLENWATAGRPTDIDIRYGLRALRARARLDAQNVDHVRGFLAMVVTNVVGRNGVILQSRAKLANGKPDKRTQSIVEDAWAAWGKRGVCDVTGQQSWAMLQRAAARAAARDGEAIFRVAYGFDNPYGFALQEIDAECLDINLNQPRERNRPEIRMGVEFDAWRRPVAYYLSEEPGISGGGYYRQTDHERVPADEIIHLFLPEWCWQSRGVPWAAASLSRLHVLASYEDAEVAAASISARKLGFYKRHPEAPLESELPETQDLGVGEFEVLPPYYEFQGWDPQHPSTAYGDFVKSCLRSVATGLGVSYNMLANDLEGVNYSSLRQGALTERDMWMTVQDWFVDAFCDVVFGKWLDQQLVVTGTLASIPEKRMGEARRVSWQPRRWPWVDPLKDMQANREAVALRTRSISDIIRESGRDPQDVWDELASDVETLRGLGLEIGDVAQSGQTTELLDEQD